MEENVQEGAQKVYQGTIKSPVSQWAMANASLMNSFII